jgi:four helix bundle protein
MSEELKERTKEFAHRCVKLAMALPKTPLGNHIRGQLIRCSTSVASNYRAACHAQSKAGFIAKIDGLVKSLKITNIQFSHPVISMGYEIDFCGF